MYTVLQQMMDGINLVRKPKVKIGVVGTMRRVFQEETGKRKFAEMLGVMSEDPRVEVVTAHEAGVPDGIIYAGKLSQTESTIRYLLGKGVDGLVITPSNYGDEEAAAKIAMHVHRALRVPIYTYVFPDDPILEDGRRVGDQECGFLPMRQLMREWMQKNPGYFPFCNYDSREFKSAWDMLIRVCSGVSTMRNVRGLQFGADQPTFYAIEYPRLDFQTRFGLRVETIELLDVVQYLDEHLDAPPDWFGDLKKEIFDGIDTSAVDAMDMRIPDKLALTLGWLVEMLKTKESNCLSIRCWAELMARTGIMVCPLNGILYENGIMAACETDWPGNLASAFLHGLGLGDDRDLNCFADLTRWDRGRPLKWHCGPFPKGGLRCDGKGCLKPGWIFPDFKAGGLLDGQWAQLGDVVTMAQIRPNPNHQLQLIGTKAEVCEGPTTIGTHFYVDYGDPEESWIYVNENSVDHHHSVRVGDYLDSMEEASTWIGLDTKPALWDATETE